MWEIIRANQRRSVALIILMAAFLLLVGYSAGELFAPGMGAGGLALAFIIWVILTLVSYFSGDSIFLGLSRARKIGPEDHPVLFNVVEEMTIASGLPKVPDIYIIDDPAPNAFATGRKPETASVAVTAGLLRLLTRDELQGVIAHELGHIKNRDVLYMMIVGIMMGTIVMLADISVRMMIWGGGGRRSSRGSGGGQAQLIILVVSLVLIILSPIIAQLIYFSLSRKREYLADASSALFTRYPEGLAGALEKLSGSTEKLRSATRATAPMYIVNPLKVSARGLSDLTSTHPPLSKRVQILRNMAGAGGFAGYNNAFKKVTGRPVGVIPASALSSPVPDGAPPSNQQKDQTSAMERFREVGDLLWKLNSFIFISCACGTQLKIPPEYAGKKIECPHCLTMHSASAKLPEEISS